MPQTLVVDATELLQYLEREHILCQFCSLVPGAFGLFLQQHVVLLTKRCYNSITKALAKQTLILQHLKCATHTLHFFTICQQLTKVFAMDFWVKHCHLNYTIFSHRPCTVLGMHFKLNIRYITPVFEFFYYRFTHSFIRLWTTDHWTWLSRQFQPICLIQCTGNLYPQNRLAP